MRPSTMPDHDDIEYQRALNAPPMQVGASPAWYWLVVGIILLVILRAFLRAAGVVESWRDFFFKQLHTLSVQKDAISS